MNWKAQGFLILSKFFTGYGIGFGTTGVIISTINIQELTVFNLAIYPCLTGLAWVFPQLGKTFSEASAEAKRR